VKQPARTPLSGCSGQVSEAGNTRNEIAGGTFLSVVIQGREITVQLPPEGIPALMGLPTCSPGFTGRDADLDELLPTLAPPTEGEVLSPSARTVTVVVNGIPGVGKPSWPRKRRALHWAAGGSQAACCSSTGFGYDARRRLTTAHALEGFLRALGLTGEQIPPLELDRARLYASVLTAYTRSGRRVLVVVDNVSDHEQARALLPTDWINAAIVTSRDRPCMIKARQLTLDVLALEYTMDRSMRIRINDYLAHSDSPAVRQRQALTRVGSGWSSLPSRGLRARAKPSANDPGLARPTATPSDFPNSLTCKNQI
jgi:hypothetical protein